MNGNDVRFFNQLKEPMRSIGYRVIVKGQTPEEVARITDMTPSVVEEISKLAMKRILELLEQEHDLDELNALNEPNADYEVKW